MKLIIILISLLFLSCNDRYEGYDADLMQRLEGLKCGEALPYCSISCFYPPENEVGICLSKFWQNESSDVAKCMIRGDDIEGYCIEKN